MAHAPRADVITDTGTGNTPHDANGVGWYYNSSYSWGFAPQGDSISRNSCDTDFGGSPEKHLCWHTGGGFINGGWRCGTAANLNTDSGWERLIYEGSLSCGDGVIDAGEECDDNNLASGDGCNSGCQIEECYSCTGAPSTCFALPDGSDCEDGLFCNGGDTCSSATCTVHTGDPCSGGGECGDTCNEATNTCADPPYTACTDDGNVCTSDYCDGAGACTHPDSYYNYCDDGLFCNGSDLCYGGGCNYHYGDPCYYADCNQNCDEGTDTCTPSGSGTPCNDDGNICTSDSCDGLGDCLHPPTANGSFCYDDGNVCTTDACDGAGTCGHPAGPSGVPCPDDGQVCTGDECDNAGACGHPPLSSAAPCPSDGNACTSDHCDGAGACSHPAVADGTGCDDDDSCSLTDECEGGTCVGSNVIVCTSPACIEPGTCDPSSGTCTTCPPGYTQGGGGCRKTYAIDVSLLDNASSNCSPSDWYTDCSLTPFGFHWTDTGNGSVGAVTRVDLAFTSGVDCSNATHAVTLNGLVVGSFPTTYDCYCLPTHIPQSLPDLDTSTYIKGGSNAVLLSTNSCLGLSTDASGAYALVTVTYADPGPQPAVETGCRTGLQSKLKYKNSTTNTKDKLGWKWLKGAATSGAEFGDPTDTAAYQLCVFGQSSGTPSVLFAADVPANATSWSPSGSNNFKYNDSGASQEGLSKILLKGGAANKAKVILKGKGANLSDPTVPLAMGTTGVLVQLKNEANGLCWQSTFPIASVSQNATGLKASAP